MFTLLLVLFIYTVLVLFFIPLEKIGHYQTQVKNTVKRILDKDK